MPINFSPCPHHVFSSVLVFEIDFSWSMHKIRKFTGGSWQKFINLDGDLYTRVKVETRLHTNLAKHKLVCLASSVGWGVSRSDACSLMCAGGPGSIPGSDHLDSGFQPSGVGKMSSCQYVDGWPLQKTAKLKRAAVRWPRMAYAASGAHYHTWFPCG